MAKRSCVREIDFIIDIMITYFTLKDQNRTQLNSYTVSALVFKKFINIIVQVNCSAIHIYDNINAVIEFRLGIQQ